MAAGHTTGNDGFESTRREPRYQVVSTCRGGGYMYCRTIPPHPKANANGLYPLHRVVAENIVGRPLRSDEHVHHIDEDKSNNSEHNLVVLTAAEHRRAHSKSTIDVACFSCGKVFGLKPHAERLRRSRNVGGRIFCSRACGAARSI